MMRKKVPGFEDIVTMVQNITLVLYALIIVWAMYCGYWMIVGAEILAIVITLVTSIIDKRAKDGYGMMLYALPVVITSVAINVYVGWWCGSQYLIVIPLMLIAFNDMEKDVKRTALLSLMAVVTSLKILNSVQYYMENGKIIENLLDFVILVAIMFITYCMSIKIDKRNKKLLNSLVTKNAGLERMNETDALTQVYNRAKIEAIANAQVNEMRLKDKQHGCVAIGFIDIDDFKKVNDTYTHEAGDEVLRAMSKILKDVMRASDSIGRWGGEEFIMVLSNVDEASLVEYNKIIRRKLDSTVVMYNDYKIRFTITMGVCMYDKWLNFDDMRKLADEAMYYGKQTGKNRTILVDSKGSTSYRILER